MARPELDFGPPEHTATEGVRFRLWGPGWEEWFTTMPEAPSGVLGDLQIGIQYDDQRRAVYRAPNLIRFVINVLREQTVVWVPVEDVPEGADVVTPDEARDRGLELPDHLPDPELADPGTTLMVVPTDDVARFYELVNDKTRVVPVDQLGRCVKGLSEALANRPTPPSGR